MPRTSGQTSDISESPRKDRLVRAGLGMLRGTLTFFARCLFGEVDGQRYSVIIPEALFSPWRVDTGFQAAYARIADRTLVNVYRCYELWQLAGQIARRGGNILEVGVWRGGTGCLLAARAREINKNVKVFLCDTFSGIVKVGEYDSAYRGGDLADTSKELVEALASDLGLGNLTVLEGVFPEQTGHLIEAGDLGFCHVDVDVYQSAKDVVEWVWPRLQVGGVIVFDDYGFAKSAGVTRYVDQLSGGDGLLKLHNLNGHAVLVKTSLGTLPGRTQTPA